MIKSKKIKNNHDNINIDLNNNFLLIGCKLF